MSASKRNRLLDASGEEIRSAFLPATIKFIFYTALWIPVFLTRFFLIQFVRRFKPNYGRILSPSDSCFEEIDITSRSPVNCLKFTLVLEDPSSSITLQSLQTLFTKNVLEAKVKNKQGEDELRYPELKQHQVDFCGYKFWKDDSSFNISNHITEEQFSSGKFPSISKIHEDLTNKTFLKKRSPWEMILVRNYGNEKKKSLLIFRHHHSLGDTKSTMKLLVEGLGQKTLKLPEVNYRKPSLLDSLQYYMWLPFYFVYLQVMGQFVSRRAAKCPWKWRGEEGDEPKVNLAISRKIEMKEIKAIAKRSNITGSAVIMAAVAGGVAKSERRLTKSGTVIWYVLPMEGHPEKLANHGYNETLELPTDINSPPERLQQCNSLFKKAKASNLHVYDRALGFQVGTWFNPLRRRFLRNECLSLIVTNIAGESEGFKVGDCEVSEFTMTCSTSPGALGVIICAFSYKDVIEVSVAAKDGILSEAQTYKLTELIEKEFESLKKV